MRRAKRKGSSGPPMDLRVMDRYFERQPDYNPLLAKGFAHSQSKYAPQYIADRFHEAEQDSFPEGLKLMGYYPATPEEAFKTLCSFKKNTKIIYDISHSDMYIVMYRFSLHGKELKYPIPIMFPNIKEGNIMRIRDSWYQVASVLGDIAISKGHDYLFVQSKMKLKFQRLLHQVNINGKRKTCTVVWSQINNSKEKQNKTCLMHYLLVKYGLEGVLHQYCPDAEIEYGSSSKITRNNYPLDEWVHVKTAREQFIVRGKQNVPQLRTDMMFAVRKSDWNERIEGMLASFFYIADTYPMYVHSKRDLNDVYVWQTILGDILSKGTEGAGRIISYIETHLESVDTYMTSVLRNQLRRQGLTVDTIYDLFADLIGTFSERVTVSSDEMSTMYDKCYIVLRYVLADIISGINKITFDFQKKDHAILDETAILDIFRRNLHYTDIYKLTGSDHAEVSSYSSVTDTYLYKGSMPTLRQQNVSKGKIRDIVFGPTDRCHASIAEIGQPFIAPTKDPTGRQRMNIYAVVDQEGFVGKHEDLIDIVENAQREISL